MIKKSLISLLLTALVFTFTTGCENIDQDSSLLEIAQTMQETLTALNNDVLNEVVEQGIEEFSESKNLYYEDENGAIVGESVVSVYPFKMNNLQWDGTITVTNYQPDVESPVINGAMDCHVGAFYRPAINGLLFLGFPIVTDFTVLGSIELSGRVDAVIDLDLEYNGLQDPKVYRCVINGVDYAELLQQEIEKAKAAK